MRTIKIHKDWFGIGCNIYKYDELTLEPGLTVLVGCNGSGKSTLIHQIKSKLELENEDMPIYKYDNLKQGGSNAREKYAFNGQFELFSETMNSSEGENIIINLEQIALELGEFMHKNKDSSEVWILFDAIDSGLSIDNVIEIKDFFNAIFENKHDKDVYIIVSANEYEMVRGEKCLDVNSGNYIQFKNYDKYRSFIIKNREIKNKRKYKKNKTGGK